MNTSSSEGSARSSRDPCAFAVGRDRGLERARVAAGHMQAGAERRHHVDARLVRELVGQARQALAVSALTA